mgnify:CR=1 FL=1
MKNNKTLDTLVQDIYEVIEVLNDDEAIDIPERMYEEFGRDMEDALRHWATPVQRPKNGLRMSNIGRPLRRLWYDLNTEQERENIDAPTFIKFLYGHLLEVLLLFFVRLSGHVVQSEQKEVTVSGIKGHMDSVIDGEVIDVKTASGYAFKKFKDEKVFLGPEMKSTGEVMGIDMSTGSAFLKAMKSDGYNVPKKGTAFLSVNKTDRKGLVLIAKNLVDLGFNLVATKGTCKFLNEHGIICDDMFKVGEGRPNVVDEILNDNIQLVVNTPEGPQSRFDEEAIGKTSVMKNILTITTLPGARAAIDSMKHLNDVNVKALQEYFKS